jgi:hypothetical protein
MPPLLRTWVAFAALGVGVVHLSLAISAPLWLGPIVALLGAAELAWAIATLASEPPAPRIAIGVVLGTAVAWAALTTAGDPAVLAALRPLPLAIGTLLGVAVAVVLAVRLRRRPAADPSAERDATPASDRTRPVRHVAGAVAGALVVAVLVTPALAASAAGEAAVPHGSHLDLEELLGLHGH